MDNLAELVQLLREIRDNQLTSHADWKRTHEEWKRLNEQQHREWREEMTLAREQNTEYARTMRSYARSHFVTPGMIVAGVVLLILLHYLGLVR